MAIDPDGHEWWNPTTWDWKEIGKAVGVAVLVGIAVVGLLAVSAITGGLAGAAIGAIAVTMGFNAAVGGISAIANGTSVWGGITSGAIKGAAIGVAIGLGIMTGGGAFTALGGVAALTGAVALNFGAGVAAYAIDKSSNKKPMNPKDAIGSGAMQAISSIFAFGIGAVLGVAGFYNVPGATKLFSAQGIANTAAGLFIKTLAYYPFGFVFSFLQKKFFNGD